MTDAAFYCVSSGAYFRGAVGLVNSLRLLGHREPIHLLDCGLTPRQRELLAGEVNVVPGSPDASPYLQKTVAPLRHPAEVMVLIDADIAATRSLSELIARAAEGRVVAFANEIDRFVPEWGELLGLGPARRRPYLSSGLVALGGELGAEVMQLQDQSQARAEFDLSIDISLKDPPQHPFLYLDQDVLNAILCTRVEEDRIDVLDQRLAPHQPYRGLRLLDEATLRCAYADGTEPYVLHQYIRKPWLSPMYHGMYSRLLSRLWLGDDVAVRLPEGDVPRRMRRGPAARLERRVVDAVDLVRWYVQDVLPERVRARRATRRRTEGGE